MSLSGNKVLMTLSNTPLLKLEPSIQLGQRPALPQKVASSSTAPTLLHHYTVLLPSLHPSSWI